MHPCVCESTDADDRAHHFGRPVFLRRRGIRNLDLNASVQRVHLRPHGFGNGGLLLAGQVLEELTAVFDLIMKTKSMSPDIRNNVSTHVIINENTSIP